MVYTIVPVPDTATGEPTKAAKVCGVPATTFIVKIWWSVPVPLTTVAPPDKAVVGAAETTKVVALVIAVQLFTGTGTTVLLLLTVNVLSKWCWQLLS